jgi:hypothetical protein
MLLYSLAKDILNPRNYPYLTLWVVYNTINNPRCKAVDPDEAVQAGPAVQLNTFTYNIACKPIVKDPKS